MKKALVPFVVLSTIAQAQVNFTAIPKKMQLYARNVLSDTGTVIISGTVNNAGANYSGMRVKVYRNNSLLKTLDQNLAFNGNTAAFSIAYSIKSELAEYKFEALGVNGSSETVLKSADSVVCGDAILISGQSNAVARNHEGASADANQSPFIRVLGTGSENGSDSIWRIGEGDGDQHSNANTGQWGLRMARLIVDNQKIPVAIFNGAHDGRWIQFFMRNDANHADPNTNYGRLVLRVRAAGLTRNIRALIWHQGESNAYADANALSLSGYKSAVMTLINNWQEDFPSIEKFYVFQIRSGCGDLDDSVLNIKEAQRQLADVSKVTLMSTSAQNHIGDDCHYHYDDGYQQFGENIYRVIRRDLYGMNADNIDAPRIKFAEIDNNGLSLKLIMEDILDSISWVSGSQSDFRFKGASPSITGGITSGNSVMLTLGSSGNNITGVSFNGHQNTPEPMVKNLNGVGALHFKNIPITTPHYRDSVSLAAILRANNITLPIDSFSVFNPSGRIVKLNLGNRKISKLHPYIGFMDSLKTIDLTGNRLTSLPREIVKLSPSANLTLDYNRLCGIPDTIKQWIGKFSKNENWQSNQLSDSLHYCNGDPIVGTAPWRRSIAAGLKGTFSAEVNGGRMTLRFANPAAVTAVKVITLNGLMLRKFSNVAGALSIDLRDLPESVVLVRVELKGNGGNRADVKRVPLF